MNTAGYLAVIGRLSAGYPATSRRPLAARAGDRPTVGPRRAVPPPRPHPLPAAQSRPHRHVWHQGPEHAPAATPDRLATGARMGPLRGYASVRRIWFTSAASDVVRVIPSQVILIFTSLFRYTADRWWSDGTGPVGSRPWLRMVAHDDPGQPNSSTSPSSARSGVPWLTRRTSNPTRVNLLSARRMAARIQWGSLPKAPPPRHVR